VDWACGRCIQGLALYVLLAAVSVTSLASVMSGKGSIEALHCLVAGVCAWALTGAFVVIFRPTA